MGIVDTSTVWGVHKRAWMRRGWLKAHLGLYLDIIHQLFPSCASQSGSSDLAILGQTLMTLDSSEQLPTHHEHLIK